jgi:CheY-like chemotaxis protein
MENKIALLVIKLRLPGVNGLQLARRLQQLPNCARAPALLICDHQDFRTELATVVAAGGELLGSPYLFPELALKALTVLRKPAAGN